ncbi:MAG: TRAP transporter small permease [Betaproteobacteria bacterium]|nr:TRAP transporter small permease [Betaproteobacteria bacterium]PWB66977.1 MAG: C4-dicarboxylate ABC transporter permease [Betaproteobacteria bacterium]
MLKVLDHLEEWIIALLMGSATVIIFVAVVHRYATGIPIPGLQDRLLALNLSWAQELCIYMFVWMAKFGAAYGVRTGIHVGVDVFINQLGPRKRAFFVLFGLLAGALFTGIVATMGAHFVWEIAHTDQVSPDLEVPAWIVYLAIPLGSSLMCFRFLQVAWSFFRTGELPHHDHGHVEGVEKVEDVDIIPVAIVPDLHPKEVLPKGHPRREDK